MTISYNPATPEPGEEVTLTMTTGGVVQRDPVYELTSVPEESELEVGPIVDNAGNPKAAFTPDVAGDYGISGYRYARRAAPSRFAGAASGQNYGTIAAVETATVYVVEAMQYRITTSLGHAATLTLTITNDEIMTAELDDFSSRTAASAADDSAVQTALANLIGESSTTISSSLDTIVRDMRAKYEAHRVSAVFHASADSTNIIDAENPRSDEHAIVVLNELRDKLSLHQRQGVSGGTWHTNDDTWNFPLVPRATDIASAHILYADLWRIYEAHRTQATVHGTNDTTNTLSAVGFLHAAIKAFLVFVVTPSATGGRASGVAKLEDLYGFRRT
jgi:hypothetical protein